ncbi:MAG: Fe-S cluster assembly protein SufD, partial [Nitrospirae bacterium]
MSGARETTPRIPDHYRDLLERRPPAGHEPAWLAELRGAAKAAFLASGFPTPRDERWHYTSLAQLERVPFHPPGEQCIGLDGDDLAPYLLAPEAQRLVFLNGRLAPPLCRSTSLPAGVRLAGLAQVLGEAPAEVEPWLHRVARSRPDPVVDLNTALAEDGALLEVAPGADAGLIELLFLTTAAGDPLLAPPRNLIRVGAGGRATVVEVYRTLGEGPCLADPVTEIEVAEEGRLTYVRLADEGGGTFHTGVAAARLGRGARLTGHLFLLGGRLARLELTADLAGEGAEARLSGLLVGAGRSHRDLTTSVDHTAPATTSRERVRAIADGRARACFSGLVHVHAGAAGAAARMANDNLLLSDRAEVDTRPQLRIDTDEVKASHGATVGRLDEAALFYLRSRGVAEAEARALLIGAFAAEIVGEVAP